jgi:hypothetical protein
MITEKDQLDASLLDAEHRQLLEDKYKKDNVQTPLIVLDKYETQWIKLIKCGYKDKYPINTKNWIDTLKPMFEETYGWDPNEHYNDFLGCIFNKLLDIYLKISLS